jgi:prepilin-type N-terminal cleavage/methylation domain-containing protein
MGHARRHSGFSLLEVAVAVAVLGVLVLGSTVLLRNSFGEARAKGGVRALADLMMLARVEAIRTGDNHVVFFGQDAEGIGLSGPSGQPAAALLIRDSDADGKVDSGERVAAVNVDSANSLSWGSAYAALSSTQAPEDNPDATFPQSDNDYLCCTFLEPDADAARWAVFFPDGLPRAFQISPSYQEGDVGTGNGAVYVTSGGRDYSVVLAALGGVRVHAFPKAGSSWTQ